MRIFMASVLLAASCFGQALGTWKMNPAKSWYPSGPLPKALTVRYEPHRGGEISTWYSVRADGTSDTTSRVLHFDGKEYACDDPSMPERPDTVVARRLDGRTAEIVYKNAGRVVVRLVRTVSADGKRMTLDIHIAPEKGPSPERTLVFEREN